MSDEAGGTTPTAMPRMRSSVAAAHPAASSSEPEVSSLGRRSSPVVRGPSPSEMLTAAASASSVLTSMGHAAVPQPVPAPVMVTSQHSPAQQQQPPPPSSHQLLSPGPSDNFLDISLESTEMDADQRAAHEADTLPMDAPKPTVSAASQTSDDMANESVCTLLWVTLKRNVRRKVRRFMVSNHMSPTEDASYVDQMRYALLCPPHGRLAVWSTLTVLALAMWGSAYLILGPVAGPPHGSLFWVLVIMAVALLFGKIATLVRLPALLGMLVAGIVIKNIPGVQFDDHWQKISSTLRSLALIVILTRAGLGLDPDALKRLSGMVIRLAFTPCIVETTVVAVFSHLLMGLPWLWGFMLGFCLAAVSPAVVVPCLLAISEKGYGVAKGIPTLVIAAASVDDVLAISGFFVLLGITFKTGTEASPVALAFQGPIEALAGLAFGIGWGVLCTFLPDTKSKSLVHLRFAMLFLGGILAQFGSQSPAIDLKGAGALAVLVMAFVAGIGWKKKGWTEENPVSDIYGNLWVVFQPLLFSLIGTEIRVSELDGGTVGKGLLVLAIGLVIRVIVTFFVVMGGDLDPKERLFVAFAWFPKATVQAALGPYALDKAVELGADHPDFKDNQAWGLTILTVAVLAILVTAPIGSAAIMLTHPFLLTKDSSEDAPTDDEENERNKNEPSEQQA